MRLRRSREKGKDPLTGAIWQTTTRLEMEQAERQQQIDLKNKQGKELFKRICTALEKNGFKVRPLTVRAQDVVIFYQITAKRPHRPHFSLFLQVVDNPDEPQAEPVLHFEMKYPLTPENFNSPTASRERLLKGETLPELVEQSAAALADFLNEANDFIR